MLFEDGASGKRLDLSGRVLNTEGKPVTLALLDVWQTLDVLQPNGEAQYDNEGFGMRGRLYTNDRGFYRLRTLIPTPHVVGNRSRPAHIHFKISAPEGPILTTQLYIKGDPNIVAGSVCTAISHDPPEKRPGGELPRASILLCAKSRTSGRWPEPGRCFKTGSSMNEFAVIKSPTSAVSKAKLAGLALVFLVGCSSPPRR